MCGLVGAVRSNKSVFDHKIRDFMEKGLYISALRGTHGTGVGIVNKEYEVGHVKSMVDSPTFLQTNQWEWAKKELIDARVILGHTRHSTVQGSTGAKNSHPFQYRLGKEEVILTHNGHVNNAWQLTPNGFQHPVDSAHVAMALLREPDPVKVLEKLMGFWALAWFDNRDNTFRITRNHTRDLYYAYSPDKTKLYYASEAEMLAFVCEREGIKLAEEEFHEIEPAQMLVWDLSKDSLAEPAKVGYEEKKDPPSWKEAPWQTTVGRGPPPPVGQTQRTIPGSTGAYSRTNPMVKGRVYPQDAAQIDDIIYCAVDSFETFTKYSQPASQVKPPSIFDWGYIIGTRRLDARSTVRLESVQRNVMDKVLKYIGDGIPCIVDRVVNFKEDGVDRLSYWAHLDKTRIMLELRRAITLAEAKRQTDPDNAPPIPNEDTIRDARVLLNMTASQGLKSPNDRLVPGPDGEMTFRDWLAMAELACMMCDGLIIPKDVGRVKFYEWTREPGDTGHDKEYQMICPTCCAGMKEETTVVNLPESKTVQ